MVAEGAAKGEYSAPPFSMEGPNPILMIPQGAGGNSLVLKLEGLQE